MIDTPPHAPIDRQLAYQDVLHEEGLPGGGRVVVAGLHELLQGEGLGIRHDLEAQLLGRGVQRERQVEVGVVLRHLPDPVHHAHGGDGYVVVAEPEAAHVHHPAHGADHARVVLERLPHAHEHLGASTMHRIKGVENPARALACDGCPPPTSVTRSTRAPRVDPILSIQCTIQEPRTTLRILATPLAW